MAVVWTIITFKIFPKRIQYRNTPRLMEYTLKNILAKLNFGSKYQSFHENGSAINMPLAESMWWIWWDGITPPPPPHKKRNKKRQEAHNLSTRINGSERGRTQSKLTQLTSYKPANQWDISHHDTSQHTEPVKQCNIYPSWTIDQ